MDLKANLTKAQTTVKTSDMKLKHNAEALKKAKAEMKKVSFQIRISSHCLDLDLNDKRPGVSSDGNFSSYLIRRSGYCWLFPFPVGGNGNNPIYPQFKHMDGAWDMFWIKSLDGTFKALQKKYFGPKKFWITYMGQKVPGLLPFRSRSRLYVIILS